MQLNDLAGQERDDLLNDSGIANLKVENEMGEMDQKLTSSPVKKYSPKVKLENGATIIPIPNFPQFHGDSEALDAKVKSMMEKCNYMVGKNKDNSIYLQSV